MIDIPGSHTGDFQGKYRHTIRVVEPVSDSAVMMWLRQTGLSQHGGSVFAGKHGIKVEITGFWLVSIGYI